MHEIAWSFHLIIIVFSYAYLFSSILTYMKRRKRIPDSFPSNILHFQLFHPLKSNIFDCRISHEYCNNIDQHEYSHTIKNQSQSFNVNKPFHKAHCEISEDLCAKKTN